MTIDQAGLQGWEEYHDVRPGFMLYAGRVRYDSRHRDTMEAGNDFKLHFKLEGKTIIGDGRGNEAATTAGTMSYLVQPRGSLKFEQHLDDEPEASVTLVCSQTLMAELVEESELTIPRPIMSFIEGRDLDFHCGILPLPATLRSLLLEVLDPPYAGAVRSLLLQARAMEILCGALSRISEQCDQDHVIRPRDLAKVREVCEILQGDPFSTTSITRLSRMVAWNETQMTEQFRRITGMTVFGYRHKLRMDHALRLLQTTDQSITQIAFDAGYEHASNFATAFKRTFGFPPRQARVTRGVAGKSY